MSDLRERAIKDVAEAIGASPYDVENGLVHDENFTQGDLAARYAVSRQERVLELEADLELQKGANHAQDERERKAAEKLGMVHNCDWPDEVAERVLRLEEALETAENKLRAHDGLAALKNGIPETTGDAVFDEVLRLYPVAAMIQRQWLGCITGFDDLPSLKWCLLKFFEAKELSDLLDDDFFKKSFGVQIHMAKGGK